MFLQFNKQKQSKIYITRNANNSQVAYNRFEKYKLKFVNVAKRLKFAYEQFKWIDETFGEHYMELKFEIL